MSALAVEALERHAELPEEFHRKNRAWFLLGVFAFSVSILTVWLMVSKVSY